MVFWCVRPPVFHSSGLPGRRVLGRVVEAGGLVQFTASVPTRLDSYSRVYCHGECGEGRAVEVANQAG